MEDGFPVWISSYLTMAITEEPVKPVWQWLSPVASVSMLAEKQPVTSLSALFAACPLVIGSISHAACRVLATAIANFREMSRYCRRVAIHALHWAEPDRLVP